MFKDELSLVPNQPGSYQMFDKYNKIIYVGKAKNLKKRLSSYFNRKNNDKTQLLVNELSRFEYIVTNNEIEAFILELNLIKKHNPKYNILLTDDKTYPYIEYTRYPFPSLKVVRYLKIKKAKEKKLFGPFPNAYAAKKIVNLINRLYPLKKCQGMPKQLCLYFHIGECLGYCVNEIPKEQIIKMENEIIGFLSGNDKLIKEKIVEKINYHAQNLNFEFANMLKEELSYMNIILDKQKVELNDLINRDVINYYSNEINFCITIFFIRNGKLLEVLHNVFPIINNLQENIEEYIVQFYEKHELPQEILIDLDMNYQLLNKLLNNKVKVPLKGKKKKLLELVKNNAEIHLKNNQDLIEHGEKRTLNANNDLKKLLNIEKLERIESFDNSNLFGNYSVSGMTVFIDGKPAKKEYRKYKINIDKNNDYQMMKEVIYRRYYRLLLEKKELPDLIIVDGGIIQINACKDNLSELNLNIKVCGLKKDEKHSTNVLIDGNNLKEYEIDKTSDLFHYLNRIQEETHRFTINYHKNIRSKGALYSILDQIPGIGSKRKKLLLLKYNNIEGILNADANELNKILPKQIANNLIKTLKEKNQ